MTSSDRPRRPDLDRDGPDRGFGNAFGEASREARPGSQPETFEDDVARGVGVGYKLIEEYLRRGQQVAQSMWSQRTPEADFGTGSERMLEYTAQVVGLWFEMVKSAMPNPAPPARSESPPGGFEFAKKTAGPAREAATAQRREPPTVSLSLDCRLPIEVTIDLRADCLGKELVAFDLRTADGEAPRLQNFRFSWLDEHRLRAELRVPDDQPGGTYVGVIVDAASNLPLGTITATIQSA